MANTPGKKYGGRQKGKANILSELQIQCHSPIKLLGSLLVFELLVLFELLLLELSSSFSQAEKIIFSKIRIYYNFQYFD